MHSSIIKHKAAMDQLRKGLSILGLLDEMEKNPTKFEKLFVHQDDGISSSYVKSLLKIQETAKGKEQVQMLFKFIENCNDKELSSFLAFLTGSPSSTGYFSSGSITVSVEDIQGFFASTCILELKIPSHIENYIHFENSIRAVLQGTKFTTL